MNDLIQQLINPVIHKPVGGRFITERETQYNRTKLEPRAGKPRSPKLAEEYKLAYEMKQTGLTLHDVARNFKRSKTWVSTAIKEHLKLQEEGKDG